MALSKCFAFMCRESNTIPKMLHMYIYIYLKASALPPTSILRGGLIICTRKRKKKEEEERGRRKRKKKEEEERRRRKRKKKEKACVYECKANKSMRV